MLQFQTCGNLHAFPLPLTRSSSNLPFLSLTLKPILTLCHPLVDTPPSLYDIIAVYVSSGCVALSILKKAAAYVPSRCAALYIGESWCLCPSGCAALYIGGSWCLCPSGCVALYIGESHSLCPQWTRRLLYRRKLVPMSNCMRRPL